VTLAVERLAAGGVLVRLESTLDYHAAAALDETLRDLVDGGYERLALDLTRAMPLDEAAIGVLYRTVRAVRPQGGVVALAVSDPRLREALEVMGLDRMLRVSPTLEGALEALGEAGDGGA
jgi:anti-sigma B factor antagonist